MDIEAWLDADPLDPIEEDREPVFIFATSWRTGSTLVQRIVMTDPRILIFGEPYGRAGLFSRPLKILDSFSPDYPRNGHILSPQGLPDPLHDFPANCYPTPTQLLKGLRDLYIGALASPAADLGYPRWGIKEVRLSASEAQHLLRIFPSARFVVVTRHPLDVYRSAANHSYWRLFPESPVSGLGVIDHWSRTAVSWEGWPYPAAVRFVRYEDIVSNRVDWDEIGRFVGLTLSPAAVLQNKTGHTLEKPDLDVRLEREILDRAREGMRVLGYE